MPRKSQDLLRRIAVHVEEPEAGRFEWVLSEAGAEGGDDWRPLKRARKAVGTFHEAVAGGLVALEALTDDLDLGPRAPAQADTDGATDTDAEPPPEKAPRKRTAFGFGGLK